MKEDEVVCLKCVKAFQGKFKSTFLGFKKYACPHCGERCVYDLRPFYRVLYWILSIGLVVSVVEILTRGDIPIPGLLGVATVWSLISDRRKRKEIGDARNRAASVAR